ncbi:DUF1289 domain-containing protein [Xenorhabdus sp. Flor]|uniref:DUF1289 domain-containing protein n=1 Tax=Xenorhabdus cabanillasii TaxID=351673 RepID=UPI0019B8ABBA|nr:DUF1289 domain-containing protein [Xenorhabdus sp. Flor]MBD2813737.1 DUF1289 domain-containing protein [Xenorhabdus sp. Flor]
MAEQLEFFAIPNPCKGICESDTRGFCRGCYRSREERFMWMKLSDGQKREVLRLCRDRYLRMRRNKEHGEGDPSKQLGLF